MIDSTGIMARYTILKEALEKDAPLPLYIKNACATQSKLAKLSLESKGITPISLNTLKVNADKHIADGGWEKLNRMRKDCVNKNKKYADLETPPNSSRNEKERDITEVDQLKEELDIERRTRLRLEVAYENLLRLLRGIALSDENLADQLERYMAGFSIERVSLASHKETQNGN